MKTVLIIVGVILFPALIYLCAFLFGFLDMKSEKLIGLLYKKSNIEQQDEVNAKRTRYSKRRRIARYIFFGTVALLFLILSLSVLIEEGIVMAAMVAVFGILITLIPLSLCLQVWLSYEIIEDDGILVHRVFSKRFVKYTDMAYYKTQSGAYKDQVEINVYSLDNKRLIWIFGDRVGTHAVLSALDKNEIKRED